jgi:hypothetical protein
MRRLTLGLGTLVVVAAGFAGAVPVSPTPGRPLDVSSLDLPSNSCAIVCPAETAYAGIKGSVTCNPGYAPKCQCTDAAAKQSSCERLAGQ